MIAVLMVFDAFTTQAWFDMMGWALSPRVRARVITINSLLGSTGGLGAGLVVAQVLASPRLPFPTNYAVLFFLAWLFITFSLVSMLFIRERVSDSTPTMQAHPSNFNATLRAAWQNDPAFRRLLLSRLLTGVENMAAAFYIVFARERIGLPESAIGVFTIAYVVGGFGGIALFGTLSERFGPRRTINAAAALQFLAPLIAFVIASLQPSNLPTFNPPTCQPSLPRPHPRHGYQRRGQPFDPVRLLQLCTGSCAGDRQAHLRRRGQHHRRHGLALAGAGWRAD